MPSVRVMVGRFLIAQITLQSLGGQLLLLRMTCKIVACSLCLETYHFSPVGRRGGPQELKEKSGSWPYSVLLFSAVSFPRLGASCSWEEPILLCLLTSRLPDSSEGHFTFRMFHLPLS